MKISIPLVKPCARCKGEHANLAVTPFSKYPPPQYNAWATCPTTGEPILILLTVEPEPPRAMA